VTAANNYPTHGINLTVTRSWHRLLALGIAVGMTQAAAPARAQEVEESDNQAWFQYEIRNGITDKLRTSWNLGYRELISTEDLLGKWSRLHLQGGAVYAFSRRVSFEGGIGGYYTFQDNPDDRFELRLWQGAVVRWPQWRLVRRQFDLRHRFRLEQRWIRDRDTGQTDFGLRFRYRLATFIPLNRMTIEDHAIYVPLMSEWFSDLGSAVSEFFAARLRLTTGLGYVVSPNWTLEFRYTAQRSRDEVSNIFTTTDHIFDFRIRTALRIRELGLFW
jgi:hypothetical protein